MRYANHDWRATRLRGVKETCWTLEIREGLRGRVVVLVEVCRLQAAVTSEYGRRAATAAVGCPGIPTPSSLPPLRPDPRITNRARRPSPTSTHLLPSHAHHPASAEPSQVTSAENIQPPPHEHAPATHHACCRLRHGDRGRDGRAGESPCAHATHRPHRCDDATLGILPRRRSRARGSSPGNPTRGDTTVPADGNLTMRKKSYPHKSCIRTASNI